MITRWRGVPEFIIIVVERSRLEVMDRIQILDGWMEAQTSHRNRFNYYYYYYILIIRVPLYESGFPVVAPIPFSPAR